jgi:hypothetical protein
MSCPTVESPEPPRRLGSSRNIKFRESVGHLSVDARSDGVRLFFFPFELSLFLCIVSQMILGASLVLGMPFLVGCYSKSAEEKFGERLYAQRTQ